MIQAFGLTSNPRKELPPAVDDVSFEARAGRVTALLGASGAGKTTALRLMLELQRGRGITYFRGRPLHRVAHPSREVGVLLGDVPGHPARTVRGHLRMLCAAAGVRVRRADEVLEAVGLVSLRDERLGTLSRGMDRRLGLACALLADPHTLVLDDPARALSVKEARWLHGTLRAHAEQGGTVLFSTADPKEAARTADHVVTLERGRVVADQDAADFSRTRLRPRVAVRSPHAARLAALLTKEARTAHRSVEVVRESGNRLAVYGSTCAAVGETAFRHGILVHQLADEVGDMGTEADEAPMGPDQAPEGTSAPGEPARPAVALPPPAEPPEQAAAAARPAASGQAPAADGAAPPEEARPSAAAIRLSTADAEPLSDESPEPADDHPRSPAGEPRSPADAAMLAPVPRLLLADEAEPPLTGPRSTADGPKSPVGGRRPSADESQSLADELRSPRAGLRSTADGPQSRVGGRSPSADESQSLADELGSPRAGLRSTADGPQSRVGGRSPSADGPQSRVGGRRPSAADPQPLTDGLHSSVGGLRPVTDEPQPSGDAPQPTADGPRPSAKEPQHSAKEPRHSADTPQPTAKTPQTPADTPQPPANESPPRAADAPPADMYAPRSLAATLAGRPRGAGAGFRRVAATRGALDAGDAAFRGAMSSLPPPISVRSAPSPLRPLRYELRRAAGIGTGFLTGAAVLVVSALTALVLARIGHTPQPRLLVAWPQELPLPPAALGAGFLGALAFGDEFRHPALAADRGTVPRRLGLLTAKLIVSAATAVMLAVLTVGCDAEVLYLFYGGELARIPSDWITLGAGWIGLVVGCAWAGVLAAGVFRSTTAGLAAVLAVPVLVVPLVQKAWDGPSVRTAAGLPLRLREVFLAQWPFGGERYLAGALRVIGQPVGSALTLSLTALLCAYLFTNLRSRVR
ncbi:ATP-binding cassette domain-containing protein [Streptomyces sp. TRM S81-3]|uniref:ATP-binding cassette domain-containing protein n=1 Tax=Streptomyces griseicoloratus TaxID=2752516 RepID=A0A926QPL0_9ACTN|nr:ATP-binding cassette domain-containing protein [Streptomyces griseicoloratus]MBD0418630.1 ATP-binding cassette domain-containing protein [Streptomyces griseicoloratus]